VSGATHVVDVRLHHSSQLAGFPKKDDLAYFLKSICGMEYLQLSQLPILLDEYRKKRGDWATYEKRFLDPLKERRIEETLSRDVISGGCLMCNEEEPDHCHRRLVAEYLHEHWGGVEIVHLP